MRINKNDKIWSERAMSLGIVAIVLVAIILIALIVYGLIEHWSEIKSWLAGISSLSALIYLMVWWHGKHRS